MRKIISKKLDKMWGYEIWLSSPLKGMETTFENGEKTNKGPLIKIIKADMPLSVQVHPDDQFARKLEGQHVGKSESWYILEHGPQANLIIGLKNYDAKVIRKMLDENIFEQNLKLVNVKKGDFFNIPAGLVHGIGANIKILEVQQPSDITYRYFDYNRLQDGHLRELHVDKAIMVQKNLTHEIEPISRDPLCYQNVVGSQTYLSKPTTLENDAIVVDIDHKTAYFCNQGEEITFKNYCIVSL